MYVSYVYKHSFKKFELTSPFICYVLIAIAMIQDKRNIIFFMDGHNCALS